PVRHVYRPDRGGRGRGDRSRGRCPHRYRPGIEADDRRRRDRLRGGPHEVRLHHLQPERGLLLRLWLLLPGRGRRRRASPLPLAATRDERGAPRERGFFVSTPGLAFTPPLSSSGTTRPPTPGSTLDGAP